MYRKFGSLLTLLCIIVLYIDCINRIDAPETVMVNPASCDECHAFPGSQYCRADTMILADKVVTYCVLCHSGAIVLDSTELSMQSNTLDTTVMRYHDKLIFTPMKGYPATDSLHANGTLDFNPVQCILCHSYPPATDGHIVHIEEKKKCIDCHLYTVVCEKPIDNNNDTVYTAVWQYGPGNIQLPVHNPENHLNNYSGDVVFKDKMRKIISDPIGRDTSYIWNPVEKSCLNITCHVHSIDDYATQHYKKELW